LAGLAGGPLMNRPVPLRALLVTALVVSLGFPLNSALADPSIDAATQASQVNQEECANVHTLKHNVSAAGMQRVVKVWAEVGRVYEDEGKASYLLFWRGVLAQCLGRNELAILDLETFIQSQKGQQLFVALVRQAKTRLKRLGGRAKAGAGRAAQWLRLKDVFEVEISYGPATGVRGLACTDSEQTPDRTTGLPLNSTCVGGGSNNNPTGDSRQAPMRNANNESGSEGEANADFPPPFWPVGLRVGLGVFPMPILGISAVLILDRSTRSDAVDVAPQEGERVPGPTTQVFVGPQLRILSSVASGRRAGELRIAPQFAMAFGQSSPWAGSKYVDDFDFLDAGTFSLQHLGVHVEVAGKVELSPKVALRLSGELGIYVPSGPDRVGLVDPPTSMDKTWEYEVKGEELVVAGEHGVSVLPSGVLVDDGIIEVQEKVEIFPQLGRATRLYASGRAALLVPHPKANLAVGPFFEVGFHATELVFPNLANDVWYQRDRELKRTSRVGKATRDVVLLALDSSIGDKYERKVYSTRRHDLLFRVGVEVHFGVGLFRAAKK